MSPPEVQVMIVAGEPSGDVHASRLLGALAQEVPGLRAFGMGGREMREAGAEIVHEYGPLAVVGFGQIPKILPLARRVKNDLIARVRRERPRAVILVDFPGFNLSLAKSLRKLPDPPRLIYFIPPQVWAWGAGRARTIAEIFDLILTIYPFEPDYFRREGGEAEYIGSLVAYGLRGAPSKEAARAALGLPAGARVAAFLPGSRSREIDRLLGPMLDAARLLKERSPGTLCLVSEAEALPEGAVRERAQRAQRAGGAEGADFVRVVRGRQHELIRAADAAAVASGTATLETALLDTPLTVLYASDFLSYFVAKYFALQVDYISLVNLLAGREVAPELYQRQVREERIAGALQPLLEDEEARGRQIRVFEKIRAALELEGGDPYRRAASRIRPLLEGGS